VYATASELNVGQTATVTAELTIGGSPASGIALSWSVTPPGALTLSAAASTTDGAGRAAITVEGTQPVSCVLQASTAGGTVDTVSIAVAAGRILFVNESTGEYFTAPNTSSATATALDFGTDETRFVLGHQVGGTRLLLSDELGETFWLHDLATGAGTEFTPDESGVATGPFVAAIGSDGSQVVRASETSSGAAGGIMVSSASGTDPSELYAPDAAENAPTAVSISPDGATVAFITASGAVMTVPLAGGDAVAVDLDGAEIANSLAWISGGDLLVSVRRSASTGDPTILRVDVDGLDDPTELVDPGARSFIAVDSLDNIIYDDVPGTDPSAPRVINRRDSPSYSAVAALVQRGADARQPRFLAP
jgi:hypothetical protein